MTRCGRLASRGPVEGEMHDLARERLEHLQAVPSAPRDEQVLGVHARADDHVHRTEAGGHRGQGVDA